MLHAYIAPLGSPQSPTAENLYMLCITIYIYIYIYDRLCFGKVLGMYGCIYIYIYIYIHIYIYVYIYIYIYIQIYVYM